MLIPPPVEQLNESNAAFGQTSGQQAIVGKRPRLLGIRTVQGEDVLRFPGQIRQFRHRRLHAIGHFILGDACGNLRITELLKLQLIELRQVVEETTPCARANPLRVRQKQHRISNRSELDSLVFRREEAAPPQAVI